jgi:hypothetical protein
MKKKEAPKKDEKHKKMSACGMGKMMKEVKAKHKAK